MSYLVQYLKSLTLFSSLSFYLPCIKNFNQTLVGHQGKLNYKHPTIDASFLTLTWTIIPSSTFQRLKCSSYCFICWLFKVQRDSSDVWGWSSPQPSIRSMRQRWSLHNPPRVWVLLLLAISEVPKGIIGSCFYFNITPFYHISYIITRSQLLHKWLNQVIFNFITQTKHGLWSRASPGNIVGECQPFLVPSCKQGVRKKFENSE